MNQTVEAVYEDGVIKPLQKVDLPEHARLRVKITPLPRATISLRDFWKGAGTLREEDFEVAKRIWEHAVEEQWQSLKESSG